MDVGTAAIGLAAGLLIGALGMALYQARRLAHLRAELARCQAAQALHAQAATAWEEERRRYAVERIEQQERLLELHSELGRQREAQHQLQARFEAQEATRDDLEARFRHEFEALSNRIVEGQARRLGEQSQEALGNLLAPLRERLAAFEQRVETTYQQEARERFSLQREVERLAQLNQQMSNEARNLTQALRGDNKRQGSWGELVLSRVLETSGLREGEEYVLQGKDMTLVSAEGRRLQPDVLIRLPGGRHLIIDAKVSLTAYERYCEAETDEAARAALRQHIDSVQTHIQQLGDKHYPALAGLDSPDFVLMFMPVEPAFHLALQARQDLFAYAWERKVVFVGPATLLASLKTVSSLWRMEQQNRNAQEIARLGGLLYDKFVGFVAEMDKIGLGLDRASRAHGEAMRKLRDGQGSLHARAEALRELGIQHRKKLGEG